MKTRLVAMTALLAFVALAAPACGDDDPVESGAQKTSEPREQDSSSDSGSGDSGSDSGGTDTTMPDFGDVAGSMGDCMDAAGVYFTLALTAVQGEDGAAKAQEEAEQLKAQLPEDLQDDIDVIAETFGAIAKEGVLDGAGRLNDPEFTEANQNITDYLQTTCSGG